MKVTPQEFKERMQKIRDQVGGDEEIAHSAMDGLMAEVLIGLGYEEGIAIFNDQDKWYT